MPSTIDVRERKVRREERRVKQRAASISRAEKMHEARLANPFALNSDRHLKIKGEECDRHQARHGFFFGIPPIQSVIVPFALPQITLFKD